MKQTTVGAPERNFWIHRWYSAYPDQIHPYDRLPEEPHLSWCRGIGLRLRELEGPFSQARRLEDERMVRERDPYRHVDEGEIGDECLLLEAFEQEALNG